MIETIEGQIDSIKATENTEEQKSKLVALQGGIQDLLNFILNYQEGGCERNENPMNEGSDNEKQKEREEKQLKNVDLKLDGFA